MGEKTSIAWAGATINPILARLKEPLELLGRETLPAGKLGYHCVKVSAECAFCYSEIFNRRGLPERGTGLPFSAAAEPKVEIFLHRPTLEKVLRWQRPRRIFWCSMTDLFGEFVSSEIIQECLDVAVEAGEKRGHVSQLLTKRPERMLNEIGVWAGRHGRPLPECCWPGFSAGNRELFFQRWPFIRELSRSGFAAGPLWCSYEPAVAPLVLPERGQYEISDWEDVATEGLRWIVVGGESGNKARPFDLQWARDVLRFLRPAGVACFVKQVGRRPVTGAHFRWMHHSLKYNEERLYAEQGAGKLAGKVEEGVGEWYWEIYDRAAVVIENGLTTTGGAAKELALAAVLRAGHFPLRLKDRKGATPEGWPADLRVQEWPEGAKPSA